VGRGKVERSWRAHAMLRKLDAERELKRTVPQFFGEQTQGNDVIVFGVYYSFHFIMVPEVSVVILSGC
jgi:hypothetical protein